MTKTELLKLKKDELRTLWVNAGNKTEDCEGLSKQEILDKVLLTQVFEEVTPVEDVSKESTDKVEIVPDVTNLEWTKFLIKQLSKDELINGRPTCDGVRRLFDVYFGDLLSCEMKVIDHPRIENNNRATVQCSIKYQKHNALGYTYEISDVADCSNENTKEPYCKFPSATAATMAEGRCLRKAMRFKVITNEESQSLSSEDIREQSEIALATDNQKKLVVKMSERNKIDIVKLLNSTEGIKSKSLDVLSDREAKELIILLNRYGQGPNEKNGLAIPDTILSV